MKKKYFVNENFFEKIDTEEKAYLLGFLFADGFVSEKHKYIEITLHNKDIEVLQNFVRCLYPEGRPISTSKIVYRRVVINSTKMVTDLVNLGCTQRKTFTLSFPNIPESMQRDFIRGYFDGDGSVSVQRIKELHMSIVGTIDFLTSVKTILRSECDLNDTVYSERHPERKNNIRALVYGGNIIMNRMYHYLYDNATIFLQRKHDVFVSVLEKKDYFCDKNKTRKLEKHNVLFDGKYYDYVSLSKVLSEKSGILASTIRQKLTKGWSIEEILTIPLNCRREKYKKNVCKYDMCGVLLDTYPNVEIAATMNNCNTAALYNAIAKNKSLHKYNWKYGK
jgi:hypothetical protein